MTATTVPRRAGPVRLRLRALPPLVKVGLGIAILVGVGLGIAHALRPAKSLAQCVYACGPNIGPRLPETRSYTDRVHGFSFGYPPTWHAGKTGGSAVAHYQETTANNGLVSDFQVDAGRGTPDGALMIANRARAISQNVTNLQLDKGMPGAKIGFSPGVGAFYTAVVTDTLGNDYNLKVALVFTNRGGTWVLVTGVSVLDGRGDGFGFADFDDALTRWQWNTR